MAQIIKELPVLYSFRRCPYAMRARLAIHVSKQTCLLREIVLRDKPDEMLSVSPKGTVPVLQLPDSTVIAESLDIIYWALKKNDPENWLPTDEKEACESKALINNNDTIFKFHLDRYKYPNRYDNEDAVTHRNKAERIIQALEERLEAHRYLVSDRPLIADFAIAPFIRQFANTDRVWFDAAPYPKVQNWLDIFLSSQRFREIMKKYKPWKESQENILFPEVSVV